MRTFLSLAAFLLLTACQAAPGITTMGPGSGYWRPISSPNILMQVEQAQGKLEFDMAQCACANFPKNVPTPVLVQYQTDDQRIVETSSNPQSGGTCGNVSGIVLTECMRARGWEPTLCAGRLPAGATTMCQ